MTGRQGGSDSSWPLGRLLREAREDAGLSQTAAAQRARISRAQWQNLEKGTGSGGKPVRPKPNTVTSAAEAVGLDPQHALELAGLDPSNYDPARPGRPTASLAEARDLLAQVTERQLQAVIDLLHAFLDTRPTSSPTTAEPYRRGSTLSDAEQQHNSGRTPE
ncbi:helix-turn-helix domain-containing protein [Actinokineospora sp.]|uniref:helix-turn-helix domain-containing protein n=1 Tax=Actinokineospora sp. TaxID=1872133 RepID=UPI004037CD39